MTNVALATRLDPALPSKYKRLIAMGGAIRGTGIVTSVAEFNAYTEPEAVAIVFDAWTGLALISWETTLAHAFTAEQVEMLMAMDSPSAEFFRRFTRRKINFIHKGRGKCCGSIKNCHPQ
jgi:inosine-uridine nucleoside N-ribohydrolase